jgi:hypothetical protein
MQRYSLVKHVLVLAQQFQRSRRQHGCSCPNRSWRQHARCRTHAVPYFVTFDVGGAAMDGAAMEDGAMDAAATGVLFMNLLSGMS